MKTLIAIVVALTLVVACNDSDSASSSGGDQEKSSLGVTTSGKVGIRMSESSFCLDPSTGRMEYCF